MNNQYDKLEEFKTHDFGPRGTMHTDEAMVLGGLFWLCMPANEIVEQLKELAEKE